MMLILFHPVEGKAITDSFATGPKPVSSKLYESGRPYQLSPRFTLLVLDSTE